MIQKQFFLPINAIGFKVCDEFDQVHLTDNVIDKYIGNPFQMQKMYKNAQNYSHGLLSELVMKHFFPVWNLFSFLNEQCLRFEMSEGAQTRMFNRFRRLMEVGILAVWSQL